MERLLWVCLAGAVGTGSRYLISLWAVRAFGTGFPYGTLIVNVAGCFLISIAAHASRLPAVAQAALITGFLGGFTTYSSFNFETTELWRSGAIRLAALNLALTLVLGLAAGIAGNWVAKKLLVP
jgi:CrcB protein